MKREVNECRWCTWKASRIWGHFQRVIFFIFIYSWFGFPWAPTHRLQVKNTGIIWAEKSSLSTRCQPEKKIKNRARKRGGSRRETEFVLRLRKENKKNICQPSVKTWDHRIVNIWRNYECKWGKKDYSKIGGLMEGEKWPITLLKNSQLYFIQRWTNILTTLAEALENSTATFLCEYNVNHVNSVSHFLCEQNRAHTSTRA